MGYYFTSESVSEGHTDKVCDQISDAVLDEILRYDPTSKVACETLVTTGLVVVAGEIRTNAYVEIQDIARRVIDRIGYNKSEYQFDAQSCGVLSALHGQSNDIFMGVKRKDDENQGAGDQGMMFGFACKETENYMPLTIDLAHLMLIELAKIRREGKKMTYLRPDAKSQVTVEYGEGWKPLRIELVLRLVVADTVNDTTRNVLNLNVSVGADFARHHDETCRHQGFAGHLRGGVIT